MIKWVVVALVCVGMIGVVYAHQFEKATIPEQEFLNSHWSLYNNANNFIEEMVTPHNGRLWPWMHYYAHPRDDNGTPGSACTLDNPRYDFYQCRQHLADSRAGAAALFGAMQGIVYNSVWSSVWTDVNRGSTFSNDFCGPDATYGDLCHEMAKMCSDPSQMFDLMYGSTNSTLPVVRGLWIQGEHDDADTFLLNQQIINQYTIQNWAIAMKVQNPAMLEAINNHINTAVTPEGEPLHPDGNVYCSLD